MKQYIGNCVNIPFHTRLLELIIENSEPISMEAFLQDCYVDEDIKEKMEEFPHDFSFYRCTRDYPPGIYFFTHSAIEYFYQ